MMNFSLKIGTKLIMGFLVVVAIFGAVTYYQIRTLQNLADLQDVGAKRTEDAFDIKTINNRVEQLYGLIADAIINQNLENTYEEFSQRKITAQQDIASIRELADTDEEKLWAGTFAQSYTDYFDLFEQKLLPLLETGESSEKRFQDALAMSDMVRRVNDVYAVIADAVINRKLENTRKAFDQIKAVAQKDIAAMHALADTAEEKEWAATFATQYTTYLDLFEQRLLPVLRDFESSDWNIIRALDTEIDTLREATLVTLKDMLASLEQESVVASQNAIKIRELDQEIDTIRAATMIPLDKMNQSLTQESLAADNLFDTTRQQAIRFSLIISIVGAGIALLFAFFLTRSITRPLQQAVTMNNRLAEGDLDIDIQVNIKRRDEIGQLLISMRHMVEKLSEIVVNVQAGASNVSSGSEEMAQGANEQATAIEEASSSMEEMAANIKQNADNALQTEKIALNAAENAQKSGKAVADTVAAIQQIAQKITIIEEIARQTHMLSLNATIEAAKAEQYGKGFGVVAAEVRALAERSRTSATEINDLASSSVAVAERAGEMLTKLVPDIQKTAELVQEISSASQEQNSGAGQINQAIQQLDQVIQQNASTSEELAAQAEQLQSTIAFFNTNATGKTRGRAMHDVPGIRHTRSETGDRLKVAHLKPHKNAETDGSEGNATGYPSKMTRSRKEDDSLDAEFERY